MAIIVDNSTKVMVQGITGREGSTRSKLMLEYGTKVIGGCTPGRKGDTVHGLPVFDTVTEVIENCGKVDLSVLFVPAPVVKNAAIEAIESGVKMLAIIPDRVPLHDVLAICEVAEKHDARFVGPNTVGVMSPERAVVGMMGGRAETAREWFFQGNVGVMSRSGGLSASTGYYTCQAGVGISSIVHVGGDSIVGMMFPEVALEFEADDDTELIVMIGEIGGSQEERVADLIKRGRITKPVVAYIGGKAAQSGTRYSHAGAIVEGGRGTWEGKFERLVEVGVSVVENFDDIPAQVLRELKGKRL